MTGPGGSEPTAAPLAILAGGGGFPAAVAEAARAAGRAVVIAAIRGEADPSIEAFPHVWVGRGELGAVFRAFRAAGARDLVIVGAIRERRLPRLSEIDLGAVVELLRNWRILAQGDDGALRKVARIFERRGLRIVGAGAVAPELLAPEGAFGAVSPSEAECADIALGREAAEAHGRKDLGQAVVVCDGRVELVEGRAGTDALIAEWSAMRGGRRGILVKCPKPTQDLRLDMPAIGPGTVAAAAAAGLSGIAIEAGATLVAERAETIRAADAAGLFVFGFAPRAAEEGR